MKKLLDEITRIRVMNPILFATNVPPPFYVEYFLELAILILIIPIAIVIAIGFSKHLLKFHGIKINKKGKKKYKK
jgi:hypothetical protein